MINRLVLAQRFVDAIRQERDDIIAVLLAGSVANGEDTEASDIDLGLIVAGEGEADAFGARGGANTWLEGIYIDAVVRPQSEYVDLQAILQDPFKSTHMNDALILYDPTGHFTKLQQAVRAAFMEPQWLGPRLQYWLNWARPQLNGLQEAVVSGDELAICQYPGMLTFALVSIPLLRLGISPSSSRNLVQLGTVSRQLKERICAFEGSSRMSAEEVLALSPLFFEWVALAEISKWGHLPDYFAKKAVWMAQHDLHQEAIHAFWLTVSVVAGECRLSGDRAEKALASAQSWLQGVIWAGAEVLASKVSQAQSLLAEIEVLAADLSTSAEV